MNANGKDNNGELPSSVLVQQVFRISNDLYGNEVLSAHELAKGYTRPVANGCYPTTIPDTLVETHENMKAKGSSTISYARKHL